jgi:hypothetical protein
MCTSTFPAVFCLYLLRNKEFLNKFRKREREREREREGEKGRERERERERERDLKESIHVIMESSKAKVLYDRPIG